MADQLFIFLLFLAAFTLALCTVDVVGRWVSDWTS